MKNFFKGISFSQISAGALAAVTAFLLSAKIGIAGSVIGVAVGSIVSALASQIYQNVIKASSEKLPLPGLPSHADDEVDDAGESTRQVNEGHGFPFEHTAVMSGRLPNASGGIDAHRHGMGVGHAASTEDDRIEASTSSCPPRRVSSVGSDLAQPTSARRTGNVGRVQGIGGVNPVSASVHIGTSGAKVGEYQVGRAKGLSNAKRNKRTAIIISIVSALVAVIITAGIITFVTRGEGTDHVVRNLVDNSKTVDKTPKDDGTHTQYPAPKNDSNQTPETNNNDTNGPTNQNDSGKGTGNGTGNGDGNSSGNGGGTDQQGGGKQNGTDDTTNGDKGNGDGNGSSTDNGGKSDNKGGTDSKNGPSGNNSTDPKQNNSKNKTGSH